MKKIISRVLPAVLVATALLITAASVSGCTSKKTGADAKPVLPAWHSPDVTTDTNKRVTDSNDSTDNTNSTDKNKAAAGADMPEIAEPKKPPQMPTPPPLT